MMLVFVGAISMIAGAWIQDQSNRRRADRTDRRLGLLGTGGAPSAEVRRAARLVELGASGTIKVHNCGRILHVDYERGELICERDGRRRA